MNTVTLIGRLTRDAKLTQGTSTERAFFTLAVDRPRSDDETAPTADFIGVTCFGKTARAVADHVGKGHLVGIQGRLRSGRYEQGGNTIYTIDLIANRVQFLSRPNGNGTNHTGDEPGIENAVAAIEEVFDEPF